LDQKPTLAHIASTVRDQSPTSPPVSPAEAVHPAGEVNVGRESSVATRGDDVFMNVPPPITCFAPGQFAVVSLKPKLSLTLVLVTISYSLIPIILVSPCGPAIPCCP